MERAGSFTSVPGIGGVVMGCTALVAAWFASRQISRQNWLLVWVIEAAVAALIGVAGTAHKSARAGIPLLNAPGRRFLSGFVPAMVAGALLTAVLFQAGVAALLPGTWLLLYGASVVAGGAASVRVVPLMGMCFMFAGVVAFLVPSAGNLLLAGGFGGLHLLFGLIITVKYGG